MILIGHPWSTTYRAWYEVESIEAIEKTAPNSVLVVPLVERALALIEYARGAKIPFALRIETSAELIVAAHLGAKYVLVAIDAFELVDIQALAEHYLLDTKVIGLLYENEDLDRALALRLDGVLYPHALLHT